MTLINVVLFKLFPGIDCINPTVLTNTTFTARIFCCPLRKNDVVNDFAHYKFIVDNKTLFQKNTSKLELNTAGNCPLPLCGLLCSLKVSTINYLNYVYSCP